MNVNAKVYKSLTPKQRLIAVIDALARDDKPEMDRLRETAPVHTYRMIDAKFINQLQNFQALSLCVETDLRGGAIAYFVMRDTEHSTLEFLQNMVDMEAAWLMLLDEFGISHASMEKAGCPRHDIVKDLLELAVTLRLKPNVDAVNTMLDLYRKIVT